MRSLLFLILLLVPFGALALSWSNTNLVPGGSSYVELTDTTDPPRMATNKCGPGSSVRLVPDITDTDGDGANGTNIQVHACTVFLGSAATGCRMWYDTSKSTGTLDGVVTTGTAVFYGPMGTWTFIDVTAGPSSGTSRVEIHCK